MMTVIDKARVLRARIEQFAETLSDEEGLQFVDLFPLWVTEKDYSVGDRIKYHEVLYKCVQAHTSQASWTPDLTPALWARVSIEEYPEWVQPLGVQDAYMSGDKVSHNEKHWVSTMDYNVYEPSVYGWEEVI